MFTEPSPPPWVICDPGMSTDISLWLCEDRQWPAVHTIFNFLLYLYIQDAKFTLLLAYVFESAEAIIVVFFSTLLLDKTTEKLGDSLISDMIMAGFGVLMAYSWLQIMRYKNRYLPPYFHKLVKMWVIYTLELIVLAVPTFFLYSFVNSIDGVVPLVYILMIPWMVGFYYLFAYLNFKHLHWFKQVEEQYNRRKLYSVTTTFTSFTVKAVKRYWRFHHFTMLVLFLYLASFLYRYTSVFLMAVIHNSLFLLIMLIYFLVNRVMYPRKTELL